MILRSLTVQLTWREKEEGDGVGRGGTSVGSQREETFSLVTTALARNSYPPSSRNVWSPPLRLFANINPLLNLANFEVHLRVPRPLRPSTEILARFRKDDKEHSFLSISGIGLGVKLPTFLPWVNLKKADMIQRQLCTNLWRANTGLVSTNNNFKDKNKISWNLKVAELIQNDCIQCLQCNKNWDAKLFVCTALRQYYNTPGQVSAWGSGSPKFSLPPPPPPIFGTFFLIHLLLIKANWSY